MKKLLTICLIFPLLLVGQNSLEEFENLIFQKKFEEAKTGLNLFLKSDPTNKLGKEYLGDVYGHQKNWDEAISAYKSLVDEEPNNANYQYKYGGALGMKALSINKLKAIAYIGDIRRAFENAATLDVQHIDARWALVEFNISVPAIFGGTEKKALLYAEQLEHISEVDGYLSKGYIAECNNRPEDAEFFYTKAINIGGSIVCYQKLTDFYENTARQPDKAIANIEEAQTKHKRNALHYQIGKVAAEYNLQLDKGEHCLKVYLENYSSQDGVPKSWAYYRLAQINRHKGNKTEALKWVNSAINEKPNLKQALKERELILAM